MATGRCPDGGRVPARSSGVPVLRRPAVLDPAPRAGAAGADFRAPAAAAAGADPAPAPPPDNAPRAWVATPVSRPGPEQSPLPSRARAAALAPPLVHRVFADPLAAAIDACLVGDALALPD
jgi:hypothetical protein